MPDGWSPLHLNQRWHASHRPKYTERFSCLKSDFNQTIKWNRLNKGARDAFLEKKKRKQCIRYQQCIFPLSSQWHPFHLTKEINSFFFPSRTLVRGQSFGFKAVWLLLCFGTMCLLFNNSRNKRSRKSWVPILLEKLGLLSGFCMFSLCLHGFSSETLVSSYSARICTVA